MFLLFFLFPPPPNQQSKKPKKPLITEHGTNSNSFDHAVFFLVDFKDFVVVVAQNKDPPIFS